MGASSVPSLRLLSCVLITSFLAVFPGYQFAVINVPEAVFKRFINETFQEKYDIELSNERLTLIWAFTVTSYNLGTIFGSLSTAFFAEKWGRRLSIMVLNNCFVVFGGLLLAFSKMAGSYSMLVIGRVISGYSAGLAYGLLAIYLTEVSPVRFRGFSASCQNLMITLNTFITLGITLPSVLGTWELWIPLQGLTVPFALLQIVLTPLFPESPKFLLLKRKNEPGAIKAYRYFSPEATDQEIDDEFKSYKKEAESSSGENLGFLEVLKTPYIRQPILVSIAAGIATLFTGIVVIFSYSTGLFKTIGFSTAEAQYSSLIMSACNSVGAILANLLMDRIGRRPLMLGGLVSTIGCLGIFMIFSIVQESVTAKWPAYISIVAIMVHVTIFNIGPGAIVWFISSEMTPQAARSIGATISITTGGIVQVITNFAFPPIQDKIGPYSFLTLIIPGAFFTALLFWKLPETKNRSINDIVDEWKRKTGFEDGKGVIIDSFDDIDLQKF